MIDIPTGSDLAPFFYYENKQIKKAKKSDIGQIRKFANMFRFIDELTSLKDMKNLNRVLKKSIVLNFYPR